MSFKFDTAKLLSAQQIKSNIFKIGLWTLLGRVIGLAKDVALASFLGVSAQADAFLLAFRIPNIFRATFAEGSIPGALVPITAQFLKQGQVVRARGLLTLVFIALLAAGLGLWGLLSIWPEQALQLMASGLDAERLHLCAQFLQILFPLLILFSLSSAVASVLQAANSFAINSAGPAIFNLGCILVVFIAIYFNLPVTMVCIGFLVAGFFKLLSRIIILGQKDLLPQMPDKQSYADFILVMRRFAPLAFGVGFTLLNAFAETQVASFLPVGQIALIHYVFRVFNLVLYTVALPIENILLPQVSKLVAQNLQRLNFYIFETYKLILIFALPASLLVFTLADAFCFLMLAPKANSLQLILAADILKLLCLGTFFNVFNRMLSKFFFALGDTKTPTLVWGFSILLSIVGSLLAVFVFGLQARAVIFLNVLSWGVAMPMKLFFLRERYLIALSAKKTVRFTLKFACQLLLPTLCLVVLQKCFSRLVLAHLMPSQLKLASLIFVLLGCGIFFGLIIFIRRINIGVIDKSYFLD
jgi:putative peptidoglycan lipid II flippase